MSQSVRVQVEVPDGTPPQARASAEHRAREAAVLALWQAGAISTRDAAAELELSYHDYLELLGTRGIPVESGLFDSRSVQEAASHLGSGNP